MMITARREGQTCFNQKFWSLQNEHAEVRRLLLFMFAAVASGPAMASQATADTRPSQDTDLG